MSDFALVSRVPVPALRLSLETWQHPCGLRHLHLACDDEHRAFAIAFRTQPHDDTGLPHILEHTTLCGSRKYPVRDPFFNMLRRSLQTFMNAMTYPDMTVYPFASQVAKDFDNLLDVYLDAVFAPNLHELDVAQEGHRLAPDGEGGWERAGVVFNEMKGAMNSTSDQLGQAVARALLPDTSYRFNYGGEPTAIPQLTHADLVAFHRRCYCPANALVATYGLVDVPALHRRLMPYIAQGIGAAQDSPAMQKPLEKPLFQAVPVPRDEGQDEREVSAVTVQWIWGDTADVDETLDGELLERVLLGHAGAPLRLALESSALGRSLDGSGYSAGGRNGSFAVQLNGVAVADYAKVEPLVMDTLARIAETGIPRSELDSALHQLELARREIHGDGYPFGLELCLRTLPAWNYGGDILPMLDQAPAITRLKQRFADPAALSVAIRTRLLAHPHRGTFTAIPDAGFLDRQDERIDADAQAEAARRDPQELQRTTDALAARQAHRDDPAVLPDLELSDVPARRRWAEPAATRAGVVVFTPGTNGILHQVLALPLPDLADDDLDLLPVLTQAMGQLGVGKQGYAERAAWLSARCAGVSAWTDISADHSTPGGLRAWWCAEVRGLADRHGDFLGLLDDTLEHLRLDEHERLKELLEQSTQRLQERVQGAGSSFAARAAGRGFGAAASLGHRLGGLGRLAWLKSTVAGLAGPDGHDRLVELADRIDRLRQRLAAVPRHHALIGDVADRIAFTRVKPQAITTQLASPRPRIMADTAWLTATAVNYCALAFPAVPMTHPDAAALAVAGRLLTHQVLHPRIREQGGAYGASASYVSGSSSFSLTSYRDPRLAATYDDLRDSLRWLQTCPDDSRPVKEAVLGVIADLDTPGSPAGEARARFNGALKGITTTDLDAHRQRILAVTPGAIRDAAGRWLDPMGGTAAVIAGPAAWDDAKLGWASERI